MNPNPSIMNCLAGIRAWISSRSRWLLFAGACLHAGASPAEQPASLVTDLAPVHSLVSMVVAGRINVQLLVPASASPHHYAMRPSHARAIQDAELIVIHGGGIAPHVERVVASADARIIELFNTPGTTQLADADGYPDPHAWLDPSNAINWLSIIADALVDMDPGNARHYRENAQASIEQITRLEAGLLQQLGAARQSGYLVYHDAYRYFENAFGLQNAGAIASSDARAPGAAHLAKIRRLAINADCLFEEEQHDNTLSHTVADRLPVRRAILDPLGSRLEPGATLYTTLLTDLADTFLDCLDPAD